LSFSATFFAEIAEIARRIDHAAIDRLAEALAKIREGGGRLFLIGVGGSAGNCAHAVNDFRKLCHIETYAPTDNVSELTARINDEGWEGVFVGWLEASRARAGDAILVFSVGGGDMANNVSPNIVKAVDFAKAKGLKVFGIVGRNGGHTKAKGDEVIVVPTVDPTRVTPHSEAYQAVVWHCLVSHPALQRQATKWEAVAKAGR
jgi:D-sedoheptulose 7-phosphate isomerase